MAAFSSSKKSKDFSAIDIGSHSVKVLQLGRKSGSWHIHHIGQCGVDRSMIADRTVNNQQALAEKIQSCVKQAKVNSKRVYAAMPLGQSSVKKITVPSSMSILEQEDFVQLEAPNHIPFPVEEVRMDFEVLGANSQDSSVLDVLLVAVKTDQFQNRVDTFEEAGLAVDVMDVDLFAIERAMGYLIDQNPLTNVDDPIDVLIDVGHEFTSLYVFKNGKFIYQREQNFGVHQLINEICQQLGLSAEEGEKAILQHALPESSQGTVAAFVSETGNQVNRLIQFFFAASSYNRIHRIWLSGGGAALPEITEMVSDITGVPTKIANPLSGLSHASHITDAQIEAEGTRFLTAFGLAIRLD